MSGIPQILQDDPRGTWLGRCNRPRVSLLLGVLVFSLLGIVSLVSKLRPTFTATTTILVNTADNPIASEDALLAGMLKNLPQHLPVESQTAVLSSPGFQDNVFQALHPAARRRGFAGNTRPDWAIAISRKPMSNVISITVKSYDQAIAARLADMIANSYLQSEIDRTQRIFQDAKSSMDANIKHFGQELTLANQAVVNFKVNTGVFTTDGSKAIMAQHDELRAMLEKTKIQLAGAEQNLQATQQQLANKPARVVTDITSGTDPRLLANQEKLDELYDQRLAALNEYTPTSEEVQALDRRIAATKEQIREIVKMVQESQVTDRNPVYDALLTACANSYVTVAELKAQTGAIKGAMRNLEGQAQRLPAQEQHLSDLLQQASRLQNAYNMLIGSAQQLEVLERVTAPNSSIIDQARARKLAPNPILSSVLLIFALCALASLVMLLQTWHQFRSGFIGQPVASPQHEPMDGQREDLPMPAMDAHYQAASLETAAVPAQQEPAYAAQEMPPELPSPPWITELKFAVMLRLLSGESLEEISHDLCVPVDHLKMWRDDMVSLESADVPVEERPASTAQLQMEMSSPPWLTEYKFAAVIRLISGESFEHVSQDLCVPVDRLKIWREIALRSMVRELTSERTTELGDGENSALHPISHPIAREREEDEKSGAGVPFAFIGTGNASARLSAKRGPKTEISDEELLSHMHEMMALACTQRMSYRKMWHLLQDRQLRVGPNRVLRIMRDQGLLSRHGVTVVE